MGWNRWMIGRARAWTGYALGLVMLLGVGATAYVGATSADPVSNGALKSELSDAEEGEKAGHAVVNHGRCVSSAAHAAKAAGLKGRDKGAFMSSIAKDESQVANKAGEGDCDFGASLEDALASQADRPVKAKVDDDGEPRGPKSEKAAKPERPAKPAKPDDDGDEPLDLPEL